MKISELVIKLNEIAKDEGDITVTYRTDDYYSDIKNVIYKSRSPGEEERVELV